MKAFRRKLKPCYWIITISLSVLMLTGCESSEVNELYEITDYFVESLQTTYESYGLFGTEKYEEYTKGGQYRVMPLGRLVNVKITRTADSGEYEELRKKLENYYRGDGRVKEVYVCGAGTVMIDCRR